MACSAVNWGLRSPNSNANNAYNVNTDGTLNNNNVYNANFAARPALMEYRVQVAERRKQRTIIKGGHILSSACAHAGDEHMTSTLTGSTPGKAQDTSFEGDTARYQRCPFLRATIQTK